MRKNLLPLLGIAFAVAILATVVFYELFLSKFQLGSGTASGPPVVVAARDLDRGAVLKPEDVKVVNWNRSAPLKGAISRPEQVAGLNLIAAVEVNEPITEARVASRQGGGGLGIAAGMRAVSVHVVDSSGVVAMLRPGHRVDVQVVAAPNRDNQQDVRLQTVLQRMEVLAVSPQAENALGRSAAPVITLLATPAEADMLGLADSVARIRVTLRNPMDEQRGRLPSMTLPVLFGQGKAAAVTPPLLRATKPSVPRALPVSASAPARSTSARALRPLAGGADTCPPTPPSCR
ncbi:MAG: Flp pilus assembly protein CpaB [Bryobacteraceae bacterium]